MGRLGHTRERTDTFFVLAGIRGNFEAARRRVMGTVVGLEGEEEDYVEGK